MTRRLTALVTLLLAAVLAATMTTSSAIASDTSRAKVPAGYTKLVVKVKGCNGCQVSVSSYPSIAACEADWETCGWNGPELVVRHRRVTFLVPTDRTQGLAIAVLPPWSNEEGLGVVAFQYAGRPVGSHVSPAAAATDQPAYGCWAGTSARRAVVKIRVAKYNHNYNYGQEGWYARAWATTTLPGFGVLHGSPLGTMDQFICDYA